MLLLLVEIQVGAFLQSADRPFAHISSCIMCSIALQMVNVCKYMRMSLVHAGGYSVR